MHTRMIREPVSGTVVKCSVVSVQGDVRKRLAFKTKQA